jgi:hypothetical protein
MVNEKNYSRLSKMINAFGIEIKFPSAIMATRKWVAKNVGIQKLLTLSLMELTNF